MGLRTDLRLVLQRAANVQHGQGYLQDYERVSVVGDAPNDPQDITQQEQPKAPVTL